MNELTLIRNIIALVLMDKNATDYLKAEAYSMQAEIKLCYASNEQPTPEALSNLTARANHLITEYGIITRGQ